MLDGIPLNSADYLEDFWAVARALGGVFWKFERQQSFSEPEDASWLALARGDDDEAVRLAEDAFPSRVEQMRVEPFDKARRVRVVEEPFSAYLRWEFLILKQWADLGEHIRVLSSDALAPVENARLLPEVTVIASQVTYEVLYNDAGELAGARKFLDAGLAKACAEDIERYWHQAEDLATFIDERPDAVLTRRGATVSAESVRHVGRAQTG